MFDATCLLCGGLNHVMFLFVLFFCLLFWLLLSVGVGFCLLFWLLWSVGVGFCLLFLVVIVCGSNAAINAVP